MEIVNSRGGGKRRALLALSFLGTAFCAVSLAQTESQIPVFTNQLNQLSDNAAGYLINAPGSDLNDTTLDVGDRLRGLLEIETIEDLTGGGGTVFLLSATQPTELTAVFDVTVVAKTPSPSGDGSDFVFGPTPVATAWSTLPGPIPADGVVIRFYEDAAKDYTRLLGDGVSDDGDPGLNGDDVGSGPFAIEEMILEVATGGDPFWDLGFTGVGTDSNGQPLPALGEGWVARGEDDILLLKTVVAAASAVANFNVALNVIDNFSGPTPLAKVTSFLSQPGQPPLTVDVNGSGSILGLLSRSPQGGATSINTPFDFFSNVDFVIRPIDPPPGGGEGCTPGYWKQRHHFDSWTTYSPNDSFADIFGVPYQKTLLQALKTGGGKEKALGRHAVAALLNASSPDVSYEFSVAEIIAAVQDAYASGDFNGVKDILETENELGCPLN